MKAEKIINTKQQLFEALNKLPDSAMQEVFNYTEFILTRRLKQQSPLTKKKLDPRKDPLLKLMGIADVEPFAHKIDQELYGA
jgi:hypothetical protein